jgi:hypothetical protein
VGVAATGALDGLGAPEPDALDAEATDDDADAATGSAVVADDT